MTWRYVIMANGKGLRWGNHLGIPKHLITVLGETLIERTARQILERDPSAEVVVSSKDPRCVAPGAVRHEPERDDIELDRFVPELISERTCFVYGDTYYTYQAMDLIVQADPQELLFFRTERSIIALKSGAERVLRDHLESVRSQFLAGYLPDCKGWQVRESYLSVSGSLEPHTLKISDATGDINSPADLADLDRIIDSQNEHLSSETVAR